MALSYLAPHLCCSCGEIGSILCEGCKYDIIQTDSLHCVACGRNMSATGVCTQCRVPYVKAWCVGTHTESLQLLVQQYKFSYAKSAHRTLCELLLARVSDLPANTVIVPVPTVSSHIRQRGYDHIGLLSRRFAKVRHCTYLPIIERVGTERQRGANRTERREQAKRAFTVRDILDPTVPYLLIDDVVTTGATLYYAARALKQAGAREIWVAVIAHQPLD